ncbi:hypothetical protein [Myxococcus phage Mx1]|nr:hypothetical protein [Myxococcus phage Mx1]
MNPNAYDYWLGPDSTQQWLEDKTFRNETIQDAWRDARRLGKNYVRIYDSDRNVVSEGYVIPVGDILYVVPEGVVAPKFQLNDGGRAAAGYTGETGDCVTRAIAIATGIPYREVYTAMNALGKAERPRKKGSRSTARTGVYRKTYEKFLFEHDWTWVPTMSIGSGTQVHLREGELPQGRIIAQVSKHICAVIDGVIHDTHDPSRYGMRCVYGYYVKK